MGDLLLRLFQGNFGRHDAVLLVDFVAKAKNGTANNANYTNKEKPGGLAL
jgi:hypothetical protein